jgi:endonuclease/exonuclease/phosphatase family metal-dependent hydrolase
MRLLTYNVHGLPWSRNQSPSIVQYVSHICPDVLCFQEVFTDKLRDYFSTELPKHGYTVVSPRDKGVTILGSGLLIAFSSTQFTLLSSCFYPYTVYHDIEIGANKGFQTVRLQANDGRRYIIANTHLQSNTPFNVIGGSSDVPRIRKAQVAELVRWLEPSRDPVLLMGDMNCEYSPHPHVRFLNHRSVRKNTFSRTGENLDHVAWIPTQWVPKGSSWCHFDVRGVRAVACRVDPVSYSDHFPVVVDLVVPEIRSTKEGCDSV